MLLDGILDMVTDGEFDPASYVGEVTIAVPEFIAISLASQLTALLNKYAPGVILSISSETDSVAGELSAGVLDFAIDIKREITTEVTARHLAIFSPSIWMREGHPLAKKSRVTLDEILQYPYVQYYLLIAKRVSARTDARFDRALREQGRSRSKAMVTNQLMTAIETICASDCLMVSAKFGSGMERELYRIVTKAYPDDLPHEGTVPLVLLQHKRTLGSPIHQWLSEKIVDLARDMENPHEPQSMLFD
jgi:DNA-binding transcriptional LysR family regulator